LDFHAHIEDPTIRRRMRDAARSLETSGKTVVIVSPRLVLPAELSKEMTVLDVPLPTREQLGAHLDALLAEIGKRSTVDLAQNEREELVHSAQGMTLKELEQTLALSVVERGKIDRETIPTVLREKEQVIKKSTVLEHVRWDAGLEDLGGLDLLKEFLD